jgi:hypothetical protein
MDEIKHSLDSFVNGTSWLFAYSPIDSGVQGVSTVFKKDVHDPANGRVIVGNQNVHSLPVRFHGSQPPQQLCGSPTARAAARPILARENVLAYYFTITVGGTVQNCSLREGSFIYTIF